MSEKYTILVGRVLRPGGSLGRFLVHAKLGSLLASLAGNKGERKALIVLRIKSMLNLSRTAFL